MLKKKWYERATLREISITVMGAIGLFFVIQSLLYEIVMKRSSSESSSQSKSEISFNSHAPGQFSQAMTPSAIDKKLTVRLAQYCNDEPSSGREGSPELDQNWYLISLNPSRL